MVWWWGEEITHNSFFDISIYGLNEPVKQMYNLDELAVHMMGAARAAWIVGTK